MRKVVLCLLLLPALTGFVRCGSGGYIICFDLTEIKGKICTVCKGKGAGVSSPKQVPELCMRLNCDYGRWFKTWKELEEFEGRECGKCK
jgi:hypothetical protein